MTFKTEKEAFVWIWLPGETEPVVAGRLEADNGTIITQELDQALFHGSSIGGARPKALVE